MPIALRQGRTSQEVGVDANRNSSKKAWTWAGAPAGEVLIDIEKLKRAREATHAVSKILADVFTDDQFCAAGARGREPRQTNGDKLFRPSRPRRGACEHCCGSSWQRLIGRDAFEARATALKLLADGAIDHINEWAFDRFDEPVIEDGDVVSPSRISASASEK